jgi:WD40 repeat protein
MVENGEPKMVSSGGGVWRVSVELGVGEPVTAEFSPDGELVAVSGQGGVVVVDLAGGSLVELSGLITDSLAWSSDGRFVLAGTGAGVVFFDLETGEVRPVLRDHSIADVGVVPLGSS